MHYPSMNSNPSTTLNIPAFNGGINQSVPPHAIQDNQATEIHNMWLKDGSIQTRPALKKGSANAYFLAESGLVDLGVEAKLGYESYTAENISLGDNKQNTFRLMFSNDKRFLLYDVNLNAFSTVEMDFKKVLYENCFNEGKVESKFFYTNGLGETKLSNENGYKQTFHTEVYGFMMFSGCKSIENKSIKLMFYLSPYISDDIVKFKIMVYNSVKDQPEEHTPYCPTVTLNYGESYGETLDNFNLMSNSFIAQYDIGKSLADMQPERITTFVDKGFGYGNSDAIDAEEKYGNFDAWDKVTFTVPTFDFSYISEIVLHGVFTFYTYKAKHYSIIDPWLNVFSGTYGEIDEVGVGQTQERATATKLTISYDSDTKKAICTFYDKNGNIVHSAKKYDNNGHNIKQYCTDNATATLTKDKLEINFPATDCKLTVPQKDSSDKWQEVEANFHTADIVINQMWVYCYQQGNKGNVEYWNDQNQSELVTRNSLKIWYGGTNSGYTGGTRLFVAGHPEFKNVLRWSGVNDSSYFLENNFAYIGRDDELITALNKQDGYLVVFKERELYALEYTYTTDSKNNALVYFPIKPISPYIGCDCPGTIQLIANRLTWLTSEGKVYTLYSESNYSERNVREISKHIENVLKTHSKEELKAAKSVDYDNNYIVFVGKTAYIWNYDTNPFYNYTSSEQAQKRLAWFSWAFPYPVENAYSVNGELAVICRSDQGEYQGYVLDYDATADESIGNSEKLFIKSHITSKLFDFGRPFAFKRVSRAFLDVESHGGGDIFVNFVTENGADKTLTKLSTARNRYEPRSYALRPHLGRIQRVGFEINSETPIKINTANITAEIYGEVK